MLPHVDGDEDSSVIEVTAGDEAKPPAGTATSEVKPPAGPLATATSEVLRRGPQPKGHPVLLLDGPRAAQRTPRRRPATPTSAPSLLQPEWIACAIFTAIVACCLLGAFVFVVVELARAPIDDDQDDGNGGVWRPPPVKLPDGRYAWESAAALEQRPFVRRGSYAVQWSSDVTLVTHTTADRFAKLLHAVLVWDGPVSVALYLPHRDPDAELERLLAVYDASPPLLYLVDVHVVSAAAPDTRYPVNVLRNLAVAQARSDAVFVADVDLIPSGAMHRHLRDTVVATPASPVATAFNSLASSPSSSAASSSSSRVVFVVPAFESDLAWQDLPRDKHQLRRSLLDGTTRPVNLDRCPKCHGPTNYDYWLRAKSPYRAHYHWIYEPYLLMRKSDPALPPFEERLKGYGFDKNFHCYHLALAGYSFWVLPDVFVIHVNHPVASWNGPEHHQQQWDSLAIVCDTFPQLRKKYGHPADTPVFDEPSSENCYSDEHW